MKEPVDQSARDRFARELDGNFSVVAAAGSGKTYAITERIAHLAATAQGRQVLPSLVVVTFTHRAADEMQQRARERILQLGLGHEVLAAFNRAFFGTIHSFCVRLLSQYGHYMGLPEKLDLVADDDEALWDAFVQSQHQIGTSLEPETRRALLRHVEVRKLMELARRADLPTALSGKTEACPVVDVTEILNHRAPGNARAIRAAQRAAEQWQNAPEMHEFLPLPDCGTKAPSFCEQWQSAFRPLRDWLACAALEAALEVQQAFRAYRIGRGAMTYTDQVALAAELMRHPIAAPLIREQQMRVILDEAQDTDPAQFSVLLELTRPPQAKGCWPDEKNDGPRAGHFCMVGDFQQSIFGDRADLRHYRRMHDALIDSGNAAALEFSTTFRLDSAQLATVNKLFERIFDPEEGQVRFVNLQPRANVLTGQVVRLEITSNDELRAAAKRSDRYPAMHEAREIARWLRAVGHESLRASSWREVAVLCPRKAWLQTLRTAFAREGIATEIHSEKEIRADSAAHAWLTALVTVMIEPTCSYEIVGVLREIFGVSDHDLALFAKGHGERFDISTADHPGNEVGEHLRSLNDLRSRIERLPLFEAVETIVKSTLLRERLRLLPQDEQGDVEAELEALLNRAAEVEVEGHSLEDFAQLLREDLRLPREQIPAERDAVQLLTSKKAKGAEWDAVIIPFLARRVTTGSDDFPRLIRRSGNDSRVALSADDITAEIEADLDRIERHEMERLLYVTLTRARHSLVLVDDESLFARRDGTAPVDSQLSWIRGATHQPNESIMRALPSSPLPRSDTNTADTRREPAKEGGTDWKPILEMASTNAQRFSRKSSPSSFNLRGPDRFADEREMQDTLPVQRVGDAAVAYGIWWHGLMERMDWRAKEDERDKQFQNSLKISPDKNRSTGEWDLLKAHLASADSFLSKISKNAVVHSELPFLLPTDNGSMEGVIDLAIFREEANCWFIIDWKTNRVTDEELETLHLQHAPQIAAYSRTLSEMTHAPVDAALYSTFRGALRLYAESELFSPPATGARPQASAAVQQLDLAL